jgi:hypothetical protein
MKRGKKIYIIPNQLIKKKNHLIKKRKIKRIKFHSLLSKKKNNNLKKNNYNYNFSH